MIGGPTLEDLRAWADAVEVTGMEKADWIKRAKESKKTAPEVVALQELRIEKFRGLLRYLRQQIQEVEANGENT